MDRLVVTHRQRALLDASLLPSDDPDEHLVVAFAGRHDTPTGLRLVIREVLPALRSDYLIKSPIHLEMQPAFWARVAKRAKVTGAALVIFHSHPCAPKVPTFSPSDDWGEDQLIPKVTARAPGPHATVVWGPSGERGRIHRDGMARPMVIGAPWDVETRSSTPTSGAHERQVLALGAQGHARLRAARIGVVGLGGTGSHVTQQLLHLGVGTIVAMDPDVVESSNLSRLVGARMTDAQGAVRKADVVRRVAREVGGFTNLDSSERDVVDDVVARDLAARVDLIFGCTDTAWSRLVLNALAFAYCIPVIDLGVELQAEGSMGGRVTIAGPDTGCLWCTGVIDERRLRAEQSPPALREAQRALGYVPDLDVPEPSVVSINGVVASLAVTEVLDRLVHFRPASAVPPSMLVYRLADGTVRRIAAQSGRCSFCSGANIGAGDAATLPTRPRRPV
jgi:molybdopterin/thiamine biosynthesis adenylyltransferase